ncbi:MAG: hypothetical protein ACRD2Z_15010 [Thermoanaerobaculia bacterium]
MRGRRRARADEYAQRVNAAASLLRECSPAEAVRVLAAGEGVSERQARRYVHVAERAPTGLVVPERSGVFTVRLPLSLIARLRSFARANARSVSGVTAEAVRSYLEHVQDERRGGSAG